MHTHTHTKQGNTATRNLYFIEGTKQKAQKDKFFVHY